MTISRPKLLVGAALSLILLAGCTATSTPSDSAKPSRSAAPSASPSATPTADPDELFRITAVLVTPEGGRIEFVQTATTPGPATTADTELLADNECDYALQGVADPTYLHVSVTSRVLTQPAPDAARDTIVLSAGQASSGNGGSPTAFTGSWTTYQAYCSDGLLTVPGTANGVTVYPASAKATDPDGWASGAWGVSGARDAPGDQMAFFTVESCTLELGPTTTRPPLG